MRDEKTISYFDNETPDYGDYRLRHFIPFVRTNGGRSLIDIGCGNGATLEFFRTKCGLEDLCGLDVSEKYLEQAAAKGFRVANMSVLDPEVRGLGQFDYCHISLVLHHLIGRTRKESFELAEQAVDNCFGLLKPGGHLLLIENCTVPNFVNTLAFYIKKGFSSLSNRRVDLGLLGNIGNPVVSYLTDRQIAALVGRHGEIVTRYLIHWLSPFPLHVLCIGYVVRKKP